MNNLLVKGLRFMKHRNILPSVVRCAYRICSNRRVLDMSTADAWEQVHGICPRPEGSSHWELPDHGVPTYDVSVIIPFYKTEAYAVQCIESVLSQQTDFRMETILVDDGSPDGCGEILDSYADRENVVVIHQKNQGVSVARNIGIAAARGEYLVFLDSDDYLANGAIQALMNAARAHDADMVEGSHQTITLEGEHISDYIKTSAVGEQGAGMFGYPCGKVLRRSLFQNVCFPAGHWYEDCIIATLIFPLSRTTVTIPELILYYRQNPNGQTKSGFGNPKSVHQLYVAENVLETSQRLNLNCSEKQQYLLIMELSRLLVARTCHFEKSVHQAIFIAACDVALRYQLLPDRSMGDYFYGEIVEALRNRQYNRWAWASLLI